MVIGLGAVLIGLYIPLYLYRNLKGEKLIFLHHAPLLLVLIAVHLGSIFFIPAGSLTGLTISNLIKARIISDEKLSALTEGPAAADLLR